MSVDDNMDDKILFRGGLEEMFRRSLLGSACLGNVPELVKAGKKAWSLC